AAAQSLEPPTGNVSVLADWFPNRDTSELRARIFVEERIAPSDEVRFTFSGFAEGLLARRPPAGSRSDDVRAEGESGAIARVHEAVADVRFGRFDLYAGYGRVVWGKLDELQPTDVINPLDASPFFFEGPNEARLPVGVIRGRFCFQPAVTLE